MSTPKRPDESTLWESFGAGTNHESPRDAGIALAIPARRVEYLCEKWSRQGIYTSGVSIDLGWKTGPLQT